MRKLVVGARVVSKVGQVVLKSVEGVWWSIPILVIDSQWNKSIVLLARWEKMFGTPSSSLFPSLHKEEDSDGDHSKNACNRSNDDSDV